MINLYTLSDKELRAHYNQAKHTYNGRGNGPQKRLAAAHTMDGVSREWTRRAASQMTLQWHRDKAGDIVNGLPDTKSNEGDYFDDYDLPKALADLLTERGLETFTDLENMINASLAVAWEFNEALDRKQREVLPQYLAEALGEL